MMCFCLMFSYLSKHLPISSDETQTLMETEKKHKQIILHSLNTCFDNKYRITSVIKVETDIITSISESLIGQITNENVCIDHQN